jgi:hypothetical protein
MVGAGPADQRHKEREREEVDVGGLPVGPG